MLNVISVGHKQRKLFKMTEKIYIIFKHEECDEHTYQSAYKNEKQAQKHVIEINKITMLEHRLNEMWVAKKKHLNDVNYLDVNQRGFLYYEEKLLH